MKLMEMARRLAMRFDSAHTRAHKALHLPAPNVRLQRHEDDENRPFTGWILHAR